tara:strand:+ start:41410 stop:44325 length:2916 start_codon:yes stop_codon:yes gene_type:complete
MLRKLGIGFIALAAMTPGLSAALGVGDYQLDSYLNQPLDMSVNLYDVGDLSEDQILVNLASQSDFDAAGVDRSYFLTDLRFQIERRGDDAAVLHIRSRQPVREPYLNFLVEFLWPTGRLMREYTVLLDPPSYDNGSNAVTPARVQQAPRPLAESRSQPQPRSESRPQPSRSQPSRPPQARADNAAPAPAEPRRSQPAAPPPARADRTPEATDRTYRVSASDTMWSIASRNRPAADVSVQQTMMAIQEINSEAFIDGNVNLVREGAVLRLPSADQVRYLPEPEAVSRMADQNRQWRQRQTRDEQVRNPQRAPVDATGRDTPAPRDNDASGQGRVTLVTPDTAEGASDGDGTGAQQGGSANTAALQNELAIRDENLDRLNRENDELRSRLDDIEAQMDTSRQLMNLRNEQIVALQQELRRLQEEQGADVNPDLLKAPAPPAAAQGDESENGDIDAGTASERAEEAGQTDNADADNSGAVPSDAANGTGQDGAAPKAAAGNGIVDLIMRNLLYIGALLVVLLLLLMLLIRRRRDNGDDDDDHQYGPDDDDQGDGFGGSAMALGASDASEDFGAPPSEDLDDDQMDPMERADVYVAYGQYPQAVDYLRNEINQDPQRGDLKIRLLELLKETGDEPGFRQQAALYAGTGAAVDAAIKRLGGDPGERAGDGDPSLDDLELDLASDLSDEAGDDQPTAAASDTFDDDELEFSDLDFDLDDEPRNLDLKDETPLQLDDLVLSVGDDDEGFDDELEESDLQLDTLELDHPHNDQADAHDRDDEQSISLQGALEEGNDEAAADDDNPFADLDLEELDMQLNEVAERNSSPADADRHVDADELELDDFDLSLDDLELEPADPADPSAVTGVEADTGNPPTDEPDRLDISDLELELDGDDQAPPETVTGAAPLAGAEDRDVLGDDDDFDFLGETDENATKLDLARAYIDMGDADGARDILNEVLNEGTGEQQGEARELLGRIG